MVLLWTQAFKQPFASKSEAEDGNSTGHMVVDLLVDRLNGGLGLKNSVLFFVLVSRNGLHSRAWCLQWGMGEWVGEWDRTDFLFF
jgi:hypothetical protein